MAMVGQYQGPEGTAALAVVAPVWNIIYSLGLLMGIGGSVIFSAKRGSSENLSGKEAAVSVKKGATENQYFTIALYGSIILSLLAWLCIFLFEDLILIFFGADKTLLPLAKDYMQPIKIVFPLFLFNQMVAAFLRNDKNPALATAIGSAISFLVMVSHFWSKKNTLRLVKIQNPLKKMGKICLTGFSTFFIDVAMGILTVFFNRQIMRYFNSDALAVYGPIINVSTFVQCCAYSVGQAAQPIISTNYGAHKGSRIKETLRLAIWTSVFFAIFWTALSLTGPNLYIKIFMKATPQIFQIAPAIIRTYSLSFLLLPFNIFSTYYFQAIMEAKAAFIVSLSRGLVVSGLLIFLLPLIFAPQSIWFAMPVTELIVAIYAALMIKKYTKSLM